LKSHIEDLFTSGLLSGKRIVITAGPTQEALDPVRYISNHSSGRMGYALARAAVDAGAAVCLISGPTNLPPPARTQFISVTTAREMHTNALTQAGNCDIFIAAAAVADFRPANAASQKIKKGNTETITIEFVKNPDIVADVRKTYPDLYVAGFAAETETLEKNAREKLTRKKLNMIIANNVSEPGIGFNSDQNAVLVITSIAKEAQHFDKMQKSTLAQRLIQLIANDTVHLSH
jgi:phosphopantothenoylcysteine decarboxylase/phosphopantothenate--cysteine ligase